MALVGLSLETWNCLTPTWQRCAPCARTIAPAPTRCKDADCAAWKGVLPWASGSMLAPRGELCNHAGFCAVWPKLRDYCTHVHEVPEDHSEFRNTRAKHVEAKIRNPALILRDSTDMWPDRIVERVKARTSTMHKPQQYFMELKDFEEKHGPAKPDQVVTKEFDGKTMRRSCHKAGG